MTNSELEVKMWNEGLSLAQLDSEDPESSFNQTATKSCVKVAIQYSIEVLAKLKDGLLKDFSESPSGNPITKINHAFTSALNCLKSDLK